MDLHKLFDWIFIWLIAVYLLPKLSGNTMKVDYILKHNITSIGNDSQYLNVA
jgi:hypothetical protein